MGRQRGRKERGNVRTTTLSKIQKKKREKERTYLLLQVGLSISKWMQGGGFQRENICQGSLRAITQGCTTAGNMAQMRSSMELYLLKHIFF